jgi:hypothetical protein
MKRQLDLWPVEREPLGRIPIWESVTPQERRTVISTLARLIIQAVHPQKVNKIQENSHER